MFVEFQKVSFKNFLSYGNRETVFKLQKGMNLITGQNGTGKSCVLDAISFALFGQPYRKVRIPELINRRNQKHLFVEVDFRISGMQYKIQRGLNPNKLEVYKNGNALELLSSKRLTQGEIDNILGINHHLFRQIISLAITYNRPFLSMTAGEKRDIIESIFGIKIIGEMLKVLKKNTSGIKIQTEINKKTIEILETSIKGIKKQIRDSKIADRDFEKNKKADIENLQEKINRIQIDMDSLTKTKEQNKADIIKINLDDFMKLGETIFLLEKSQDDLNFTFKKLLADEKILTDQNFCQSCKQDIDKEHKEKELSQIKKEKEKIINVIRETDKKLISLADENAVMIAHTENNKELEHQNNMIEDKLKFYKTEIDSLKLDIKTINTRSINFKFEELEKTLEEKSIEYIDVYKKYEELVRVSKMNDTISLILSEEGVKSYFFKKLIPLLNSKVNEVLNKFDLPLQISFNELMEEEIHNYSNGNDVVNYFSLSEGEKKRIDIAILLAFINVTKLINNWNANLILMDELLDSSVDVEGLDKMIECLQNYINDSKKNVCIYLISHRAMESQHFAHIYTVRKNHGFSEIELKNS